jgi:hypothetical protein
MSNEKQNDSLHWKSKLENAAGLPDQLWLDKNAAWEKLQHRLGHKRVQKKRVWYWAAAVILLLLTAPFVLRKNKINSDLVNKITVSRQSLPEMDGKIAPDKKDQALLTSTVPGKRKSIPAVAKSRGTHQNSITELTTEAPAIIHPILLNQTMNELNIVSLHAIDSTTTISIATITKKKLKVVHINELEPPVDQMALIKSHKGSYSDIKFGNRIMNNTAPVLQSSDYTSIFKIKF